MFTDQIIRTAKKTFKILHNLNNIVPFVVFQLENEELILQKGLIGIIKYHQEDIVIKTFEILIKTGHNYEEQIIEMNKIIFSFQKIYSPLGYINVVELNANNI